MLKLATASALFCAATFLSTGVIADEKYPLLASPDAAGQTLPANESAIPAPLFEISANSLLPAAQENFTDQSSGAASGSPVAAGLEAIGEAIPEAVVEKNSAELPEVSAAESTVEPPAVTRRPARIALIIDDLGNQRRAGERTILLPGPVACAIMPHTSHAAYLAEQAYASGKEVMLHLPMQPMEMQRIAGPGEISLDTRQSELGRILQFDLASIPHVVGVNNHMGSLITRHPGHMRWLMEELDKRGDLFFIDSYTTPSSVAYQMAVETGVPAARRHVFLDSEATEAHVARQFQRLKRKADRAGYAIGIGHPYPVTLQYLERVLPELSEQGFELVPVAAIIELQQPGGKVPVEPGLREASATEKTVL